MSLVSSSFLELLAGMLEPDERNAVLGDLAESGESGIRALYELLGLIARRQVSLWRDWRPWLALIGLTGYVAPHLSRYSYEATLPLHMDLRTYWKYGALYETSLTRQEEILLLLCQTLALVFWSWLSGLALGTLARETIWVSGALFFLPWLLPLPVAILFIWKHPSPAVSLLLMSLQWVFAMLLTAVPCSFGLRTSLRQSVLPRPTVYFLAGASLFVTALAIWTGGWPQAAVARWAGGVWDPTPGWQSRLFFFGGLNWPLLYLLIPSSDSFFIRVHRR
jgi:hypothetical protein